MNNPYDDYGCCVSCGYIYCKSLALCLRPWIEECPDNHRQLQKLQDFSLEQLGLFITLILGSLSACLVVCFKSRCDKIDTPCFKIHRKPLPPENNKKQINNTESNESNDLPNSNP